MTAESPPPPAAVLLRAQEVAEQLRRESEEEAAQATAHVRELVDAAARDRADAEQVRADAERVQARAEQVLQEASDEARTIVADAGEQATLLLRTAQTEHDRLLAAARQEAEQRLTRSPGSWTRPAPRRGAARLSQSDVAELLEVSQREAVERESPVQGRGRGGCALVGAEAERS